MSDGGSLLGDEDESEGGDSFDAVLENAAESLERLEDTLDGVDAIDELDDGAVESLLGDVENVATVVRETEELFEAIDFGDLPEAVDADELLEAIEVGEIPEVLADDEQGATDLVDFTQLFRAIDLLNAWDATDLTDLWREKRELDDALDGLGDGDDAGMVEDAIADVTDDEDGDLIGGDDDLIEMDAADAKEALGDIDVAEDPEAYQVAIQQQALEGIDAFRAALLETHEKFEQLYEMNREKMRRQDTSTNSRNPTAAATIPTDRRDLGGGARYSTVPQQVKLSTAPTRKRIYGRRFEIERERKRRENND